MLADAEAKPRRHRVRRAQALDVDDEVGVVLEHGLGQERKPGRQLRSHEERELPQLETG